MTVLNCFNSMQNYTDKRIVFSQLLPDDQNMSIGEYSNNAATFSSSSSSNKPTASSTSGAGSRSITSVMAPKQHKAGKRPGRKPSKINERDKLERSRQSARECRARKKLRYQYLEELVVNREKAVFALRDELKQYKNWCRQMDAGGPIPDALLKLIVNEDVENERRQREEAEKALKKQQRRQQQEQKTSSSSSSSSISSSSPSSSSSSPPKTASVSSPPSKSTSPPTSQPAVSMTPSSSGSSATVAAASSGSSSAAAVAAASRLLQQRQHQEQLKQVAAAASRPNTLKTEPSSPNWSQIEHLIPKLSPTQPEKSPPQQQQQPQKQLLQQQQQQQQQMQQQQHRRTQQRTSVLKRQMAFDASTAALQKSVQQQLQQVQSLVQKQQQQTQSQSLPQVVQEPPRLQSQLSIPESVSSFILSNEFSDSGKTQYEYQPPYQQHSSQGTTPYNRSLIQQSRQPQITTTAYSTPPNFLNVASTSTSNLNQRTFQPRYMSKAKSDPIGTDISSSNFLSMVSSPTTCSVSGVSLPTFIESRDTSRSRSLSNPSNMYSAARQPYHYNVQGISRANTMPYPPSYQQPTPSAPFGASNSGLVSTSSGVISRSSLGLFSGHSMLPSTSFPTVVAEESESPSSSDENVNEQDLFQFSSLAPHKRTLSDPILHGGKVRKTTPTEGNVPHTVGNPDSQQPSLQTVPAFFSSSADDVLLPDPHTTLKNLTTTRCFSSTRTSNTPSPSPSIGLVPMGMSSPSPTPSCSSGSASRSGSFSVSSPAPKPSVSPVPASTCSSGIPSLNSLPSLSSLYDFSSTLSPAAHAAVDTALDIYTSTFATRGFDSGFPGADTTNSTNLQASIELIPEEFYSYLADIQEGRGGPNSSVMEDSVSSMTQSASQEVNLPDIDELLGNQDRRL